MAPVSGRGPPLFSGHGSRVTGPASAFTTGSTGAAISARLNMAIRLLHGSPALRRRPVPYGRTPSDQEPRMEQTASCSSDTASGVARLSTDSGSQGPAPDSRHLRADWTTLMARRTVVVPSSANGRSTTVRSVPCHRSQVSWMTSSASLAFPSICAVFPGLNATPTARRSGRKAAMRLIGSSWAWPR